MKNTSQSVNIVHSPQITRGPVKMDPRRFTATINKKVFRNLTRNQFIVLYMMAEKPGYILTPEELMMALYGADGTCSAVTLRQMIRAVRDKIRPFQKLVKTVHSVGYRVDDR